MCIVHQCPDLYVGQKFCSMQESRQLAPRADAPRDGADKSERSLAGPGPISDCFATVALIGRSLDNLC
jgi:hypothetical protein